MSQSVNTKLLNRNYRILFSFALSLSLWAICLDSYSKVDPKNYDFSLNKFEIFHPGKKLDDILKAHPNKTLVFKSGNLVTYKFYIEHIRYKFPIFVQFKAGVVTDFYAKLPTYFLHNLFHQSLINRFGVQTKYKKVEEQAIYIWDNKEGKKHVYFGSCTITCFPVYYSVIAVDNEGDFKSLIRRFSEKEIKN